MLGTALRCPFPRESGLNSPSAQVQIKKCIYLYIKGCKRSLTSFTALRLRSWTGADNCLVKAIYGTLLT